MQIYRTRFSVLKGRPAPGERLPQYNREWGPSGPGAAVNSHGSFIMAVLISVRDRWGKTFEDFVRPESGVLDITTPTSTQCPVALFTANIFVA